MQVVLCEHAWGAKTWIAGVPGEDEDSGDAFQRCSRCHAFWHFERDPNAPRVVIGRIVEQS